MHTRPLANNTPSASFLCSGIRVLQIILMGKMITILKVSQNVRQYKTRRERTHSVGEEINRENVPENARSIVLIASWTVVIISHSLTRNGVAYKDADK